MKKVFLDANIIIDYIAGRNEQDLDALQNLFSSLDSSFLYISTLSVHISFYVLKLKPNTMILCKAKSFLEKLSMIPLTQDIVNKAMDMNYHDFEDCLQYLSAIDNCDYLLTRDKKDFEEIKVIWPSQIKIVSNPKDIKN